MINSPHGTFACMGALMGSHFLLWVIISIDKKKNKIVLGIQQQ
jgi:hypothetical protein